MRLASNEIFSPSNKIHREVGQAKDLSAPQYKRTTTQQAHQLHHVLVMFSDHYQLPRGIRLQISKHYE